MSSKVNMTWRRCQRLMQLKVNQDDLCWSYPSTHEGRICLWVGQTTFLGWISPWKCSDQLHQFVWLQLDLRTEWPLRWWSWWCRTSATRPPCPCRSCRASRWCCSPGGRSWRSCSLAGSSPQCSCFRQILFRCLSRSHMSSHSQPSWSKQRNMKLI